MPSKKSYFNFALFRYDLRRFFPIWGCASLVLLLIPYALLHEKRAFVNMERVVTDAEFFYNLKHLLLGSVQAAAPIATMLYALLPAMALFSYLYQSRSALGTHALPLHRSEVFITHYAAGLAMMALPLAIFTVITSVTSLYLQAFLLPVILQFCFVVMAEYLFFFSLVCLCVMLTGQLWGVPFFYAIANAIAYITFYIFDLHAYAYLVGYESGERSLTILEWLTPIVNFYQGVNRTYPHNYEVLLEGMQVVDCYAVVGLILALIAFCLFRTRDLECAGEIVALPLLRPVFRLCGGIYTGFCLMLLLCGMFNIEHPLGMVLLLILGCSLGFAAGQMLLEKSISIFNRKSLKQGSLACCAALVIFAGFYFDLRGYQTRVPALVDIQSAQVSVPVQAGSVYLYRQEYTTSDASEIAFIQKTHAALVEEFNESGMANAVGYEDFWRNTRLDEIDRAPTVTEITPLPADTQVSVEVIPETDQNEYQLVNTHNTVHITYTLKNGYTMHRRYDIALTPDAVAHEGSPAYYLEQYVATIDMPALITAAPEDTNVLMKGNDDSLYQRANNSLAAGAVDALLADMEAGQMTPSVLPRDYTYPTDYELNLQRSIADYNEFYLRAEARPGSQLEAYLMEKVVGAPVNG